MANLVLYRKYRPQKFADVVGQEHVVRTISNAIAANDFAHAYLFNGPRGTGKTTLARLIGKSLNCEARKDGEYEPCNKCDSCNEITKGTFLDIVEIDAASNRGIDEIRALKEGIRFVPVKGKFKVFIIDEVHMLTKEAFNALLKTLEEPPEHAVFVLATTEIGKVLPTIISRSQRFDLRKLTHQEIVLRLQDLAGKEGKTLENVAFNAIAARAGGSIRDSESILGQVLSMGQGSSSKEIKMADIESLLGFVGGQDANRFVGFLINRQAKEALAFVSELNDKGVDMDEFLKNSLSSLRKVMFIKTDKSLTEIIGRDIAKEELLELSAMAEKTELVFARKALEVLMKASDDMRYSPMPQLPIELAVMEIVEDK